MKRLLGSNLTANVLLLITCGVVVWAAVAGRSSASTPSAAEGVWPAQTAPPVSLSADAEHQSRSVVVFLNSGCAYCAQEMPFYRALQGLAAARSVRLYAASVEAKDELSKYLQANGLTSFAALPKTSVPALPATPTILLIDEHGLVLKSWRGVLSAKQKAALKELL